MKDRYGSILMSAVGSGSVEGLQYLLENGGDINYRSSEQQETLLHALHGGGLRKKTDYRPMIEFLVSNGLNPNAKDAHQQTPLHLAMMMNDVETGKILIDFGARVEGDSKPAPVDPKQQKMMERAQREMEKMMAEMEAELGDVADELAEDEEALDPDDPMNQDAIEMQNLGKQMQANLRNLLPNLQARMEQQEQSSIPFYIARRPELQETIRILTEYSNSKSGK
jgi:hypothetical protein